MIVNNSSLYHRADMLGWKADEMHWEGESLWRFALKSIAGAVGSEKAIRYEPRLTAAYKAAVAKCESPIEVKLLTGIFARSWEWSNKPVLVTYCDNYVDITNSPGRVCVANQIDFLGYRMDFMMKFQRHGSPIFLCIEADGAAYHNDTCDADRDRNLASKGVRTFRFSGKAIHKDMCEVARHIDNIAAEIELTGDFKGYEL